jgi:biotin carboxyl carrier protein
MKYSIEIEGQTKAVTVHAVGTNRYQVQIEDQVPFVVNADLRQQGVHLLKDGKSWDVQLADLKQGLFAGVDGISVPLQVQNQQSALKQKNSKSQMKAGGLQISTNMPGKVVKVLVEQGAEVKIGQGIVIVEAMKMENELRAEQNGIVSEILCKAGDLVEGGKILVKLSAKEKDA